MAGFIIWIAIIIVVVAVNKRSVKVKNPPRPQGTVFPAGNQRSAGTATKEADPWAAGQPVNGLEKQQALKERLARKYNRPVSRTSGGSDILSRAKASVEEDFGQTWEQEEAERQRQREQEEASRRARQQRERQEEASRRARQQRERQEAEDRRVRQQRERQEADRFPARQQEALAASGQAGEADLPLDGGWNPEEAFGTGGDLVSGFLGQAQVSRELLDLMVKGPNLELTFARDFIAEGVEMLNRIQA